MKANIEFELKPFTVPNFVVYDDFLGNQKDSVPLQKIPANVLLELCKRFVQDVYKKADKESDTPTLISRTSR